MPHLQESDVGSVVNVSSIAGLRAYPGALAYKMSKAAMDQMTRCTAVDLIRKGVRVNSVNPGVVETDIFARSGMSAKAVKGYLSRAERTHPNGRPGRPEEVAKVSLDFPKSCNKSTKKIFQVIAFLASPEASLVVGQTLAVDGGRSVLCPS